VSGWPRDGTFELTPTKANYWHRSHAGCAAAHKEKDKIGAHLRSAGLEVRWKGSYWVDSGGSLLEGWPDYIWTALSGQPATHDRFRRDPHREWPDGE